MVDAAASFEGHAVQSGSASRAVAPAGATVAIHQLAAEAIAAYGALGPMATFSPAQSPAWIGAWIAEARPDLLVAILSLDGMPSFALAIEIVRSGPFRVARFMGGHHANGNFCPFANSVRGLSRADLDGLIAAIGMARPDIDLLSLERIADGVDGRPNPLMLLPHMPSPNLALAVDLAGGFDALLERASGKRKRKKNRSQKRKLEAAGGFRFVKARTAEETASLLDAFFAMKQERFRKMGVADVFAGAEVRGFFRKLFAEALSGETPAFVLDGLEVDGRLRAVTGSSRCGKRMICEFGAIREDEVAHISPGDFLFFENIRKACEEGLDIYDFSVGDEPYKRLWCDVEITQYDVIVPLTAKGKVLALTRRAANRAKAFVKNNRLVWRLAKALRRRKTGQTAVEE